MRKLDPEESGLLNLIITAGGTFCPSDHAGLDPFMRATLKRLVNKKRLTAESFDGVTRFTVTALGREGV